MLLKKTFLTFRHCISAHLVSYLQYRTFAIVKKVFHILFASALLLGPIVSAGAQGHVRRAMREAQQRREAADRAKASREKQAGEGAGYMTMRVENGDTTYLDAISPIYILERGKGRTEKQWRDYYKLVWRFARVYPYAEACGVLIHEVDSTLNAENYRGFRRERYISAIQKQLFKDFEGAMKDMTISQGALLMKLIDRETGLTPYSLIKDYKSGVAAGFWQGIAKLFDNDLKAPYDPEGADKEVEELVQIWQVGEFKALYWSVFWEEPPVVKIPPKYRRQTPKPQIYYQKPSS